MRNEEYWSKRARIFEEAMLDTGGEYIKNLDRQYAAAIHDIETQIRSWYQRFAKNNGISLVEARRLLTTRELSEFRWSVEEYIKYGEENAISQAWMKELENASARVHISRLDSLRVQLRQQAEALHGKQSEALQKALAEIYERGYYHTAFEIQKGIGVGWSLQGLTDSEIKKVLARPWTLDGRTFSDRIWANKQALVNTVNTQLTQMIMRGQAPDKAIKAIADRFGVSKRQAGRLVMTESAAFANAARKDCFNDLGVDEYVIVETLDVETCELCGGLDGKVFKMSDYEIGVTAPPFHPWCRGTTAPYFADIEGAGERYARDVKTGETYKVPKDMTYKQWAEKQKGLDKSGDEVAIDKSEIFDKPASRARRTGAIAQDVSQEYIDSATPGQGNIIYDEGYKTGKHQEEIKTAEWLRDKFGGSIRLLSESTVKDVKMPDYIWRDKMWELKKAISINGADKSLQHAVKQIQENPGGVIIKIIGDLDVSALENQLNRRFIRSNLKGFDLMLLQDSDLLKVLRYKK